MFQGNIASIDPRTTKQINLMFEQGAQLPREHPRLEGGASTVLYLRFADRMDVAKKKEGPAGGHPGVDRAEVLVNRSG